MPSIFVTEKRMSAISATDSSTGLATRAQRIADSFDIISLNLHIGSTTRKKAEPDRYHMWNHLPVSHVLPFDLDIKMVYPKFLVGR